MEKETLDELARCVRARRELPAPAMRRMIRLEAGASLEDVARTIGVTRQAVALWEAGLRTPRATNLSRYSAVLKALHEAVT